MPGQDPPPSGRLDADDDAQRLIRQSEAQRVATERLLQVSQALTRASWPLLEERQRLLGDRPPPP